MFPPAEPASLRRARKPVIWLLALALVVYGCSSVLVQLLGPTHRHSTATAIGATWLERADAAFRGVRAWRAELHARWLPGEHAKLHAGGHETAAAHGHAEAHAHAETHVRAHDHAADHAHAHAGYQRHHHAADDGSVMALDGEVSAAADAASAASAGSATLPLGLSAPWALPPSAAPVRAWASAASVRWTDAATAPLDQPPRA